MPAFGGDHQLSGSAQLFLKLLGIAQKQLVRAGENQRGRQFRQIRKQRGGQRIFGFIGIALGIAIQQFPGEGGVGVFVGLIGITAVGQVYPGGDGNDAAGHRQLLLFQLQAEGIAKSAAGAFTAEGNVPVAFLQQIFIGCQGIFYRGREGMLRCQPVGAAEDGGAAFIGEHRAEAGGIVKAAAGITASVQI